MECGATEFEEYKQGPDSILYSKKRKGLFGKRVILDYEICVKCGTVNRIYVQNNNTHWKEPLFDTQ